MRCAEAHDAMLVADPASLRGEGENPLAMHVRACPRCQLAAERIDRGTRLLGAALVERQTVQHRRWNRGWTIASVPAVAAAALLMFVGLKRERAVEPMIGLTSAATEVGDSAEHAAAGIDVAQETEMVSPTFPGAPFGPALDSTSAVPTDGPPMPSLSQQDSGSMLGAATPIHSPDVVSVRPARGQRVAVLRTADPKVTLVWLY